MKASQATLIQLRSLILSGWNDPMNVLYDNDL
jgi:hypothetical protein